MFGVSRSRYWIRGGSGCLILLFAVFIATRTLGRQAGGQAVNANAPNPANSSDQRTEPPATFKSVTHHVVVDVVAKDKPGHAVRNLTAKDFQVFEKVGWAGKVPQTIAAFRLVDKTQARPSPPSIENLVHVPAGSYSNIVAVRQPDDPLTVVLLDDLNTDLYARETRRDVLKMVDSNDINVPIAVFFLGNSFNLLQNFDSDPKHLRATVHKLLDVGPFRNPQYRSLQGPSLDSQKQVVAQLQFTPLGLSPAMQQQLGVASGPSTLPFAVDAARVTDDRVFMTLDALRAIARHLGGYPGRKKLVWISDSFPFSVLPDPSEQSDSAQSYRDQVEEIANALSTARVAVYPIRTSGVWLPDVFTAARKDRPANQGGRSAEPQFAMGQEISRQSAGYEAANGTMQVVGDQTGGESCLSSNDLGWCLKQALSDGYTYYELAYYPPPESWKEGFHRIMVRTTRSGVHLSYRQGYYVASAESVTASRRKGKSPDTALKQAACEDLLPATGLPLTVTPVSPGGKEARFLLKVEGLDRDDLWPDSRASHLQLTFASCTFDPRGDPIQYRSFPVDEDVNAQSYEQFKQHGFERIVAFFPDQHADRIRWVVENPQTGNLGSVDLPRRPDTTPPAAENLLSAATSKAESATLPSVAEAPPTAGPTASASSSGSTPPPLPRLQSSADIVSYCEGLGQGGAHADALAKVCEFTWSLGSKLPDILCERRTTRHWRANNDARRDELITEVAYRDGMEYDSDATVAAKPNRNTIYRRVGSSSSSGEFMALLNAIFQPASYADFSFQEEQPLNSASALVFEFSIEQNSNRYYYLHASYVDGREAVFYPAYHGRLWIDKSALRLLRIERETSDVPASFPISYASTTVDYAEVPLGDGTTFVLPVNAEVEVCSPGEGKECAHDVVRYRDYHKFRASTKVVFDEGAP